MTREIEATLIGPASREWFVECFRARGRKLANQVPVLNQLAETEWIRHGLGSPRVIARLAAHVSCANDGTHPMASDSPPPSLLAELPPDAQMPAGLVRDLWHEFRHTKADAQGNPRWTVRDGLVGGELRPIAGLPVSLPVLVTQDRAGFASTNAGIVCWLTVELIPHGTGDLYPHPALTFVEFDPAFEGQLQRIRAAIAKVGAWPKHHDIRWVLGRRDEESMPLFLRGPSAGVAFCLGLLKLLHPMCPDVIEKHWPGVAELDVQRVAASAEVLADGETLKPVGGLWEKMGAAINNLANDRRLLDAMVVASEQKNVPTEYFRADAFMPVVRAGTVSAAIRALARYSRPRRAVCADERAQCEYIQFIGRKGRMESHYRSLPLLKRVFKERLPREADDERGAERDERSGRMLSPEGILRWEETVRQARDWQYEPVPLNRLFETGSRVVVLGPPGSGKTTLLQYISWRCAGGHPQGSDDLPAGFEHRFPVRIHLPDWQSSKRDLTSFLQNYYRKRQVTTGPTADQFARHLKQGDIVLLLDGLDECDLGDPKFANRLADAFRAFADCPCIVTCRNVSYESCQRLLGDTFPIYLLGWLDDAAIEAFVRGFPQDIQPDASRFDADRLVENLRKLPQMRPLAANPLLLNLICLTAEKGIALPATRGELYDTIANELLQRRKSGKPTKTDPPKNDQHFILARTAFDLFMDKDGARRLVFKECELVDRLLAANKKAGHRHGKFWADKMVKYLLETGMLRGDSARVLFFIHLTLHEFLAAEYLAGLVNESGWDASLAFGNRTVTVRRLIDAKSWDPLWRETILLLAGRLKDPIPLLDLLADPVRDDITRRRLCLAGECLAEIPSATRSDNVKGAIRRVANAVFDFWLTDFDHKNAKQALLASCIAVGSIAAEASPRANLIERLMGLLVHENMYFRYFVASAIGNLGAAAVAHPGLLEHLVALLAHENWDIRHNAAKVIGDLGAPAAAHPGLLEHLMRLLAHENPVVRQTAADAIGNLGAPAAAHPGLLERLLELLDHENVDVCRTAANAIGKLGTTAATHPGLLERLMGLLADKYWGVRLTATCVIGTLGAPAAAHPGLLERLIELFADENTYVRSEAAEAIGKLGAPAAAHPGLLERLIELFADENTYVRSAAANAIGDLGAPAAAHPGLFERLLELLADKDRVVRASAVRTILILSTPAAAHPALLERLLELFGHEDWYVRHGAASAIGKLGAPVAAHPGLLDRLMGLLADKHLHVRRTAASVIGKFGTAAATHPGFLERLLRLCADKDWHVRQAAADVIGNLADQGVFVFRRPDDRFEIRLLKDLTQP